MKRSLLLPAVMLLAACAREPQPIIETSLMEPIVGAPAPAPEGTVRYCWEEPKVVRQKEGPGVNTEGTWYKPSHYAVREAKMARWVPCREQGK